jgi:hypothetical protein
MLHISSMLNFALTTSLFMNLSISFFVINPFFYLSIELNASMKFRCFSLGGRLCMGPSSSSIISTVGCYSLYITCSRLVFIIFCFTICISLCSLSSYSNICAIANSDVTLACSSSFRLSTLLSVWLLTADCTSSCFFFLSGLLPILLFKTFSLNLSFLVGRTIYSRKSRKRRD